MGQIRKYARHKPWTLAEINRLELLCDKGYSQSTIAKGLGRSVSSVKSKRLQLGIPCMKDSVDKLNMTEVGMLCGVDNSCVNKTWIDRGLKTKKQGGLRYVSEPDLFRFMQQNTDLWNAMDCEEYFFADKKWFRDKLAEEKATGKQRKSYRIWNEYERANVRMLWQRGFSYREIAQRTGRSFQSVYLYINRNLRGSEHNERSAESNKKLLEAGRL